jgi:ABC-type transport system involved in multi-copper enzyme maturation permease subunit
MLLGPVFHAELLTTARRARYYVVRTIYGLIILCQIYLTHQANTWRFRNGRSELLIREMADFAQQMFITFAILQAVVLLLLTPSLVGGTIAEERQRKTLHYLLTSRLGGLEIVMGKLAARLLHVGVLVAVGLPVVCLIGLFGGIDYRLLMLTYAGTATTVYFLATLSVLVSVHSRRPREAISVLYVYELVWLFVPTLVISTMPFWPAPWPRISQWVGPWLEYVAITSPVYLLAPRVFLSPSTLETTAAWGMGLQVSYGTMFITLAAARLRAASRDDGTRRGLAGKIASFARKRRWFPRPECGDDAMLWKERYVARTGGMTKAVLGLVVVALLGLMGYWLVEFLNPALAEMWDDGYFHVGNARREFNVFLRLVSAAIFVLWSLGVASSAASGMTSEREEDTWISLVSTPLSGREILRAKLIGPVWALRHLAYLMFGLWGIGLAVNAVHPAGVLACLVELAVFTWFLTALGTAFSSRSRNSTRSLALTMVTLIFLNGAYLFCCIPLQPNTSAILAGSTPVIFAMSLLSQENIHDLSGRHEGELAVACVLGVLFYAAGASSLTGWIFQTFDAAVDRPDRFRELTPSEQRARREGPTEGIVYQDDPP